ncbi:hypothetical protein QTP70_002162 [Hemibagrus guttatus]|uniref:Uncharacterized protein n=1 Tax=Hemibagrus guttatus TaxID=175788 RepID=A0AAE0UST1_9TELE|nr:hypothetical protein QTP70_002162 [Hemibagrus guttatus]
MENLSELQNPLLDKNSKHVVKADYGYRSDFPSSQYQENIINYFVTSSGGRGGGGGGGGGVVGGQVGVTAMNGKAKSQLLDATSLHLAVEAFYKPNFILYKDDVTVKAKDYKSECCETTFTEKKEKEVCVETPSAEDPQAKLLDENEVKIQTVSYEVEEEEYVEYERSSPPAVRVIKSSFKASSLKLFLLLRFCNPTSVYLRVSLVLAVVFKRWLWWWFGGGCGGGLEVVVVIWRWWW